MKKVAFFVLMLLAKVTFAQYLNTPTIDSSTGNLVYTTSTNGYSNPPPNGDWTNNIWSGFVGTSSTGGGYSGGYQPGWNSNIGVFMFGYNQGTIRYSTPINVALANAGTGIQINGYAYSWEYINQDYSRGTLTGNISLTSNTGQTLESYNYNMPRTTNGWTTMSGTQNFNTHYALSSVGNLNVSFTGRDDRFWAGYYGPRIRDINVSMLYSVAPPPVQTDFPSWVKLTDENGNFTLTSSGVVRYGANGTYVYQNFQPGTYSCSNGAWGRDPLGGVYKECDLGSNTSPTPTPTPSVPKIQTVTTTTTDPTSTVTNPTIVTNPTTVSTPTTTLSSSSNSGNNGMTDTSSATSSNLIGSVTASPTIVSAPAPVVSSTSTTSSSSPSQSSSSSSSTGSTTSTTTATVTATVATPSGGPSKESGGGGTSIGLSVVAKNQQREQAIAMQASASAVAAADQAGKTAQQEAVSVAGSAVSNSLVQGQSALKSDSNSGGSKIGGNSVGFIDMTTQNTQTNSSATSGSGNTTTRDSTQLQTNVMNNVFTSSTQSVSVMQSTQSQNYLASSFSVSDTQQTSNSNLSYSLLPPIQPVGLSNGNLATYQIASYTPPEQTSFKIQSVSVQTESYQLKPPSVLTDRTSFINDIIEGKQFIPQSNTTINTGPVVNKDAQDNEAAGGVSINKMALAPKGYGDYLNFTMRDVAFYEPKEVYKNQKTVDNVRAFRSLANDSKHKEMVEQQYRIGK